MSLRKRPLSDVDGAEEEVPVRETKRRVEEKERDIVTTSIQLASHNRLLQYPSRDQAVKPVAIQYPSSLLTFSYNADRTLLFDDSSMKYYVAPPLDADLRYGYDRWIKRPEERGRLDGLLKAVTRYAKDLDEADRAPPQGLEGKRGRLWLRQMRCVSWRGVMTKILTAPYEERDGWELNVMRVEDTLYLEEHLTDVKLAEKGHDTASQVTVLLRVLVRVVLYLYSAT